MRKCVGWIERVAIAGWIAAAISVVSCSSSSSNNGTRDSGAAPDLGAATDTGAPADARGDHMAADAEPAPAPMRRSTTTLRACPAVRRSATARTTTATASSTTASNGRARRLAIVLRGFRRVHEIGMVICANATTAACSATAGTPPDRPFTPSPAPADPGTGTATTASIASIRSPPARASPPPTVRASGWAPAPGTSGDCGEMLVQKACSATGSGCASTGSGQTWSKGASDRGASGRRQARDLDPLELAHVVGRDLDAEARARRAAHQAVLALQRRRLACEGDRGVALEFVERDGVVDVRGEVGRVR